MARTFGYTDERNERSLHRPIRETLDELLAIVDAYHPDHRALRRHAEAADWIERPEALLELSSTADRLAAQSSEHASAEAHLERLTDLVDRLIETTAATDRAANTPDEQVDAYDNLLLFDPEQAFRRSPARIDRDAVRIYGAALTGCAGADGLTDIEREVLVMRFGPVPLGLGDIARRLGRGVDRQAVRDIEQRAIRHLRNRRVPTEQVAA